MPITRSLRPACWVGGVGKFARVGRASPTRDCARSPAPSGVAQELRAALNPGRRGDGSGGSVIGVSIDFLVNCPYKSNSLESGATEWCVASHTGLHSPSLVERPVKRLGEWRRLFWERDIGYCLQSADTPLRGVAGDARWTGGLAFRLGQRQPGSWRSDVR